MIIKRILIIIASFFCLNSVVLSNPFFIETLYEKKDMTHINLLKDSLLFNGNFTKNENSLKSLFTLAKYSEYIIQFDQTYANVSIAQNEDRYFYLISKYNIRKYFELNQILKEIDKESLSPTQKINFNLIKAVNLFLLKKYQELESLYIELTEKESMPENVLKRVEKLRDILYLQLYKPSKFIQKDEDYFLVQASNSILTGDYKMALSYYEKAGLLSTNNLILYSKGMNEMKAGNYNVARDYFSKIDDDSLNKEKEFRLIESYYYEGKTDLAVTGIKQFRISFPDETAYGESLSFIEAMSTYISGNYEVAKKLLGRIQNNNITKFCLAEIYYSEKNYKQAGIEYESVINKSIINSDLYLKALYGLAWAQFKDGQYVSAKNNFNKVILSDNKNNDIIIQSLIKIGDASYNLHTFKDALKEYQVAVNKLLSQKDNYLELYKTAVFNVARIYSKLREYQQSNEYLNQYLKDTNDISDIFTAKTMQADNYIKLKQNSYAVAILQDLILTYQPKNEDIYIILADIYFNERDYKKAIDSYQDYLKIFNKGNRIVDAKYGIVQSLYNLKDYESALKLAKETDNMFQSQLYEELLEKIKFDKEQDKK